MRTRVAARRYGEALRALDEHARDDEHPEWVRWVGEERAAVRRALSADAQACRAASAGAEGRGEFAEALRAIREIEAFGVPELAAEAADRAKAIESARAAAARRVPRPSPRDLPSEDHKVSSFFEQALEMASRREYAKLRAEAPKLEKPRSQELLRLTLECFRQAEEVWTGARQHAGSRVGHVHSFELRDGTPVSGVLEVADGNALRVASKTYSTSDLSAASVVALYRAGRGARARAESIVHFYLFEGQTEKADEILKRQPMELLPPAEDLLRRQRSERDAEALLREADRAPEGERLWKLGWIVERFAGTRPAEEAGRRLTAAAPEILVRAADLPEAAFRGGIRLLEDATARGGRAAVLAEGAAGDATFKVRVHPGVSYRCWVRVRRGSGEGRPSPGHVTVQFANSVDARGKEVFAPDTESRLLIRGTGDEAWCWAGRDLADSNSAEPEIRFRAGGEATVRIAAGASGAGFDQFVLSPRKYAGAPPDGEGPR